MVRNQYSYWLHAEALPGAKTALEAVLDALNGSDLAWPGGPMVFSVGNGAISGEVKPDEGTTEEDESLKDAVADIAARFPDFAFTFDENDEDDHSNKCTTRYAGGRCVYEGYARTLDPGEWDQPTIDAIAAHLDAKGWTDAAASVRAKKFDGTATATARPQYRRVRVTRSGYAVVPGSTDDEALENVKGLTEADFDWEPVDAGTLEASAEIIEPCGPCGEYVEP